MGWTLRCKTPGFLVIITPSIETGNVEFEDDAVSAFVRYVPGYVVTTVTRALFSKWRRRRNGTVAVPRGVSASWPAKGTGSHMAGETSNMERTHCDQCRFSFTTISLVLLLELITNARKIMARKPSLARRAADGSRSRQLATSEIPVVRNKTRKLRAVRANPKNGVGVWSAQTGASREVVRSPLHENDESPKRSRIVFRNCALTKPKKHVDTCCTLLLSVVNELASSSPKMKSGSRTIILTTPSNGVTSIRILSPLRNDQSKKDILCFFFCFGRPVYWDILGEGGTVDSTFFCKQLKEMGSRERQDKILLVMDKTRPYRATITQKKLKDLEMEWLPHPPYSPDFSRRNFRAFRSPEDYCWRHFKNRKDVELAVQTSRSHDFWRRELELLPGLWRTIVITRGKYYHDRRNV